MMAPAEQTVGTVGNCPFVVIGWAWPVRSGRRAPLVFPNAGASFGGSGVG